MNLHDHDWQSALNQLVQDGHERGIQLAIYQDGKLAVDVQAGTMSPGGPPVGRDSLFPIFSVSKGMVATVAHRLVARGILAYDRPIVDVWPEFGAHGKETITLRHALDHVAGLAAMPAGLQTTDLNDWDKMCAAIADLTPDTRPGEKLEYHAMTFGWIIGELARRADGRDFPRLLAEEISAPLGLSTLYIGLPDALVPAVAELEESKPSTPYAAVPDYACPLHALMNRADVRRACVPASNGIMSAHAIARHYAALLPGGVDGVELLTAAHVETILAPRRAAAPPGWFYGFTPSFQEKSPLTLGHGGYGGPQGFADFQNNLAVGLTRNNFDAPPPMHLIDRIYAS